jgi:lipopolysaccharide export system permease protein
MQFLWKYIDDLAGKGLNFSVISELMIYAAASFVPMALPLAVLLSSLMMFGGLGENYELIALKAAGISLLRVMYPLFILMITISIAAFFYSNISLPYFNLKMRSLIYDIQQQRPEFLVKEGAFSNTIENYSIRVGKTDIKNNLLHDILIYDHSANRGNIKVTHADSGYIKRTADKRTLIIILYNGDNYEEVIPDRPVYQYKKSYPFRHDKFAKEVINKELEGFDLERTDEGLFRNNFQMMNLRQLGRATDSINKEIKTDQGMLISNLVHSSYFPRIFKGNPNDTISKDTVSVSALRHINCDSFLSSMTDNDKMNTINYALNSARNAKSMVSIESQIRKVKTQRLRRHEIEWQKKFTLSLACIIFFLIGAPLGAIIRKGGLGMPLVISVLFFVFYYVITITGEKFVRESIIPAFEGVWISSAILLPLGLFLTYKANHDAAIMNIESYVKFINKIIGNKFANKIKSFFIGKDGKNENIGSKQ